MSTSTMLDMEAFPTQTHEKIDAVQRQMDEARKIVLYAAMGLPPGRGIDVDVVAAAVCLPEFIDFLGRSSNLPGRTNAEVLAHIVSTYIQYAAAKGNEQAAQKLQHIGELLKGTTTFEPIPPVQGAASGGRLDDDARCSRLRCQSSGRE